MRRPLLVLWLCLGFVVCVAILLKLPVTELAKNSLVVPILEHKKPMAIAFVVLVVAAGGWFLLRRQWRALVALVAAAGVIVAVSAVGLFKTIYPYADPFGAARLQQAAKLLLGTDTLLSQFDPVPALKVERKVVTRAAFPAIDVHFHLESMPESVTPERLINGMDAAGIAQIVNVGGNPGLFEKFAAKFYARYPDRIIMFLKPDPSDMLKPNGFEAQVRWVEKAAAMGARGIGEIGKTLGTGQRDASGKIVPVDDPRLDPLWDKAGELGMPVLIHTGDPSPFYTPTTPHNERYEELLENPTWSLYGRPGVPTQMELLREREHLLARHPHTNFIAAHFGCLPDDLTYVGHLLDTYPNLYVDMSSVASDLGRQPYTAREFFIKYQDRILFGSDGGFALDPNKNWTPERFFRSYVEFLETRNEYIEYPLEDVTKQGLWRIYGIDLPRDVLEKIYVLNAEKLIPSSESVKARLAESLEDRQASNGAAATS